MLELLPLISTAVVFAIGVMVLATHTHQPSERMVFAAACFSVAVWHFSVFMYWKSATLSGMELWIRIANMGAVWLPVLLYHFSLLWSGRSRVSFLVRVGYIVAGFFCISAVTPWFFDGFHTYSWGVMPQAQWLFHLFLVSAALYIVLFYAQSRHFLKMTTRAWERNRASYLVVGYSLLVAALVDILPFYGLGVLPPFAYGAATLSLALMGYTMLKIRLPALHVFFSRSIVFIILTIYVTAGFTFLTFVVGVLLRETLGTGLVLPSVIVSVIVVVMLDPLKHLVARATDRFFSRDQVDMHTALKTLSETAGREIEIDRLVPALSLQLGELFKITSVRFYIAAPDGSFSLFGGGDGDQLARTHPVVDFARTQQRIFVVDEVLYHREAGGVADDRTCRGLRELAQEGGIEVVMPVSDETALVALVMVGQKINRALFHDEEMRVFEIIAPQIASALHKAHLYQESRHFNERLRQEVKKATQELAEANRVLQEMDKTKTNFISVASHQLRTPLTSVKGMLSMLSEGDWGKLNQKQLDTASNILAAVDDMTRLVDVFLQIPGLARDDRPAVKKRIMLQAVVEDIARDYGERAKRKGLTFSLSLPRRVPQWRGDEARLKTVIRVLLDNALRYTSSGTVTLALQQGQKTVRISVSDTGKGIARTELKSLFERFTRAAQDGSLYTEGVGLGLFIAERIVTSWGGKIWAESEGEGKGATFVVELPR